MLFLWKLLLRGLPTKTRLIASGWNGNIVYDFCHDSTENDYHALYKCVFAYKVRALMK